VNRQRGAKIPTGPGDEPAHVRIVEPCRGQRETPRQLVQAGHLARQVGADAPEDLSILAQSLDTRTDPVN
jgi:hypothetical protein